MPTNPSDATPAPDPDRPLRVVAAGAGPAACRFYAEALTALGHHVTVAETGRQAVDLCRAAPPDLLVVDAVLPDADGLGVTAEVCREGPLPVVLVSAPDGRGCRGPGEEHVHAHLLTPVGPAHLHAALGLAARSFERLRAARDEAAALTRAADERKVVERAKGAVVRYAGLDEDAAYRRLRRLATDSNRRLVDVAREVLAAGEVFRALDQQADGPARSPARPQDRRRGSLVLPNGHGGHDGTGGTS